jgi:hypothetical protein
MIYEVHPPNQMKMKPLQYLKTRVTHSMKTISLKEAHEILERFTTAVVIDDSVLVYPRLSELKDSEDNEFLYLSWEDEGLEYSLTFSEGKNQSVKVSGSSMFLHDDDAETDADQTQLTILAATPIQLLRIRLCRFNNLGSHPLDLKTFRAS